MRWLSCPPRWSFSASSWTEGPRWDSCSLELPQVSTDFSSGYLLFTAPFAGRHRFSLRYERFRTRDLDGREPVDTSNENGSAWTIDYLMRIGGRHRLAFELLRIDSDRMARLTLGEAVRATENVFQLSLRIQF